MLDDAARKEGSKRRLVQGYRAAAQAAGEPSDFHTSLESPQEAMNFMIDVLATLGSDAEAARLLGLTDDQVAAARNAAEGYRRHLIGEQHLRVLRDRRRTGNSRWSSWTRFFGGPAR
jgi:hypothetical protein